MLFAICAGAASSVFASSTTAVLTQPPTALVQPAQKFYASRNVDMGRHAAADWRIFRAVLPGFFFAMPMAAMIWTISIL
jgi:hypothetical protein